MFTYFFFFFFNDTATTEIYTLSLHDALPICWQHHVRPAGLQRSPPVDLPPPAGRHGLIPHPVGLGCQPVLQRRVGIQQAGGLVGVEPVEVDPRDERPLRVLDSLALDDAGQDDRLVERHRLAIYRLLTDERPEGRDARLERVEQLLEQS